MNVKKQGFLNFPLGNKKKGFFSKLMDKLDKKMEEKAKEKKCCCSSEDEKCCK